MKREEFFFFNKTKQTAILLTSSDPQLTGTLE